MKRPLKVLIFISLLAAILSITAPLSFNIGVVPITLATFTIYLIGGITKRLNGVSAVVLYIIIGIIGVPVFSNFRGGISVIIGPTGGFILSYIPMALIISLMTSINKGKIYWYYISMLIATIVCYLLGSIWFMLIMNVSFVDTLKICVLPFIVFDLVKIAIAGTVSYILNRKANFEEMFGI